MRRDEIGDVVILHCDKKQFESPFDDVKTLPSEIVSLLKRQLNNSSDLLGDRLSRIFLNALVRLIGGYRDAFKFNNPIVFDDETFIDSQPTQFRPFVEKMLHLQIFRQVSLIFHLLIDLIMKFSFNLVYRGASRNAEQRRGLHG